MVLMFTGRSLDKQYLLFVQDKKWFFNGIDVYRTTTSCSMNTSSTLHKIGFSTA